MKSIKRIMNTGSVITAALFAGLGTCRIGLTNPLNNDQN